MSNKFKLKLVDDAYERLKNVVCMTPLELNRSLSERFKANVYLKREDLQLVRSYKLRGAYNKMATLTKAERVKGVVCASAGNHAQGFAFSCEKLKTHGVVFMPRNTPGQKINRVLALGKKWIKIELKGDTFDEAYEYAKKYGSKHGKTFIHPFNDPDVIAGQATVGVEILKQIREPVDYFIVPIGGGGLISGLGSYVKKFSPESKIIGVEPAGASAMHESLRKNKIVTLDNIDKFVDGAAVKTVGSLTFELTKKVVDKVLVVSEGKVCQEIIRLYQDNGIITEPAGALSVSALDSVAKQIRGKTIVCIVSGGNNDISRYPEIIERSLIYQGLKHYFVIEFPQKPGELRRYLDEVLGPNDDITLFEYVKKNNREIGPALVGIELSKKSDLEHLINRMKKIGMVYEKLEDDSPMFRFLI